MRRPKYRPPPLNISAAQICPFGFHKLQKVLRILGGGELLNISPRLSISFWGVWVSRGSIFGGGETVSATPRIPRNCRLREGTVESLTQHHAQERSKQAGCGFVPQRQLVPDARLSGRGFYSTPEHILYIFLCIFPPIFIMMVSTRTAKGRGRVSFAMEKMPGMRCRFALVIYRDHCDGCNHFEVVNFTTAEKMKSYLAGVMPRGGGVCTIVDCDCPLCSFLEVHNINWPIICSILVAQLIQM